MASTINAKNTSTGVVITPDSSGQLELQTADTTRMTIDVNGNVGINTAGARITGDFSNATIANRVAFQTSVTNSATTVEILPNGSGTGAAISLESLSTATNCSTAQLLASDASDVRFTSGIRGTGTYLPMTFYTGGSERVRIDTSGNVGIGVTPAAWNTFPSIDFAAISYSGLGYVRNVYYNGSNYIYRSTAAASQYQLESSGSHVWLTAPSGTAGTTATLTERMRIHASGGVSIGNTTDSGAGNLNVSGTINGGYVAHATGTTAMAFGTYKVVRVTPNATATYTTTVPPAGATCTLSILTSGTTSYTITFGTGFKTTGTLATGATSARYFQISFVSDGTNLLETARTTAIA